MIAESPASNQRIPRFSGIIERPRLVNKLSAALDHRITLITAPPGYGKTTVAAQFANQTSYPVAWHSIDERERDVPNLHANCIESLAPIIPEIRELEAHRGRSPAELAAEVANCIHEKFDGDLIYIIDDIQILAGSTTAETWLRSLVTAMPAKCRLILLGRILPDLPMTEMIARREVLAIGQKELEFTQREVESLATELTEAIPEKFNFWEVTQRLEGWPAGVVLALQPFPADVSSFLGGSASPETLFNALATNMLRAQPAQLRDFLLQSSTLTHLTPELCSKVLGLPNSTHWLTEAQRRGLFLTRTTGGLSYHGLFRDFLQAQIKQTDRALFVTLHTRVAQWFEVHNRVDKAVDHYITAELYERAGQVADKIARSHFTQGKTETLLDWCQQLVRVGDQIPRLMLACAMIYTDRYEYERAENYLTYARRGFATQDDAAGSISTELQQAMIDLTRGDYGKAAAETEGPIEQDNLTIDLRAHALRILGYAHLRLGKVDSAVKHLEEAVDLYRRDGDAYALSQALQDMNVAYMQLGRLEDSGACLQEVVALARQLNSKSTLANALNNLGYYYHLCGDYDNALANFDEGVSLATRIYDTRMESYLSWSMGDLHRDRGAFDEAATLYQKSLGLTVDFQPDLRSAVLISTSVLKRWQGKYEDAIAMAEEALDVARNHNIVVDQTVAQALLWAARAHRGEARFALEFLRDAENILREQSANFETIRVLAMRAHVNLLCSNQAEAIQDIETALELAQQTGSLQWLAAEIFHVPRLLTLIESHFSDNTAIIDELENLRTAQTVPNDEADLVVVNGTDPDAPTYSIQVQSFGHERIERDGRLVTASEWRSTNAKELFLFLLFVGAHTREQISLQFWPDGSGEKVRSNFHTTLSRARNAMGKNALIFEEELYLIDPDIDLRADATEFQKLAGQARLMPARDVRTQDLWQRAVDLYVGDFLPTIDATWAFNMRESLREVFIEALMGLSNCGQARGDLDQAVHALKRALNVDSFREDIHRDIMTCYAKMGDKTRVQAHFDSMKELFREELGFDPSTETIQLVHSLLR